MSHDLAASLDLPVATPIQSFRSFRKLKRNGRALVAAFLSLGYRNRVKFSDGLCDHDHRLRRDLLGRLPHCRRRLLPCHH